MSAEILELYPHAGTKRTLDGTYLAHDLHVLGTREQPFVYANFVSSLDGRIAVIEAHTGESYVLEDLTSGHDWRLFQELQAHADCMVTHGGYLRALAARKFADILQVGLTQQTMDIGRWRSAHGLTRQPAIAIVSRTLDFPIPPSLERHEQPANLVARSTIGEAAAEAAIDAVRGEMPDPFELYASGRTAMRLRLSALPRSALLELIATYGLNPAGKNLAWLRHHQLVTFIVTAVEVQSVSKRRAR